MKVTKAIVSISIEADCPHCGSANELTDQENNFFDGNKLPDPLLFQNEVFECEHCNKDFLLNELKY